MKCPPTTAASRPASWSALPAGPATADPALYTLLPLALQSAECPQGWPCKQWPKQLWWPLLGVQHGHGASACPAHSMMKFIICPCQAAGSVTLKSTEWYSFDGKPRSCVPDQASSCSSVPRIPPGWIQWKWYWTPVPCRQWLSVCSIMPAKACSRQSKALGSRGMSGLA